MWFVRRPEELKWESAEAPFVLGIRQLPSEWVRCELPLGLTESEALRHAKRQAVRRGQRCSLQTPCGARLLVQRTRAPGRLQPQSSGGAPIGGCPLVS